MARQPDKIVISPSKVPLWYGSAGPNDRFTREQLYAMAKDKIDLETVEVIACKRAATDREVYVSVGQMPPVYEFDCPILRHMPRGNVRVISPSGLPATVRGDGWVGSPARPRSWGGC